MCGICGELSFNTHAPNQAVIRSMLDTLKHRGPDDSGIYSESHIALGHARLSIIDLDTGKQPMSNEDGSVTVVFNGEIYNFKELRDYLEKKGHVFKTKSDTEVIIHNYEDKGIECVRDFKGMFAFAVWDSKKQKLYLVRDRLGKKPLVYAQTTHSFVFASEIKALLKHPSVKKEINIEAIDYFLTYQYIPAPITIFKHINSLLPAHILEISAGNKLNIEQYWDINYTKKLDISFFEAEQLLLEKLTQAVHSRMISDVPLGAFLSGGIDSSAVVALMSQYSSAKVKTFSIGFEEKSFSELSFARQIAKLYNTDHHEFLVKPDAVDILPQLVWHYDQPYADSSALPAFFLSRETRKHVTVALTGDGGDENFAGYLRHKAHMIADMIGKVLPKGMWQIIDRLIPVTSAQKSLLRYGKRFAQAAYETPSQRNLIWHMLFRNEMKKALYSSSMKEKLKYFNGSHYMIDVFNQSKASDLLDAILYTDMKMYLPFDLLVKMDIATMAHSLEARSPFLDHELIEWTTSLPSSFKMHFFNGKYLLKKTVRSLIPQSILTRRKMGFGVPLEHWFRKKGLNNLIQEVVLSDKALKRNYFNKEYIQYLLQEHEHKKADHGFRLWGLLMLEMWHQMFVD